MKTLFDGQSILRRALVSVLGVSMLLGLCGCAQEVSLRRLGISVSVQGAFAQIYASSAPITLTATLDDDPTNQGVAWKLSIANTSCSPGCGTLTRSNTDPRLSAVYTPPAVPPTNTNATITATSAADHGAVYVFNFTILPPISVNIVNKFTTQKSGDPAVMLNATVSNDVSSAGVTWTLTVGGQPCLAACGALTAPPSPTLTATYMPPATAPIGANASPTITATSVTDPTKSDSFMFTIVPGIVVTITNKFTKPQTVGGPPVEVDATVTGDSTNAGVSWTLLNANGQPCSNCGSLVPAASPSFSATYTPPTTQPLGPDANPMITATSVANSTKSDSFSFAISFGTSVFTGSYAFLLRGFEAFTTSPLAVAGSVTSDGLGDITGGDLDINNDGGITAVSNLSGSYTIDSSFNGIIRGAVTLTNVVFAGTSTPTPLTFKFVLSSDHKHGRVLELDGAAFVNVGTLELQDPAALKAADPTGTYAFGVDSDAPVGGRTVEAGRLILTSNSVTGGLVDESRAGDTAPRYAAVSLAASTLTPPDSSGRGTLTLSVPAGSVPASADQYAYYVVDSGRLNLIQIDAAPTFGTVFAGVARLQNQPLTANTTSVIQLTGMDAVPGTTSQVGPDVIIGVMNIPNPVGGTSSTFALTFDENDLGNAFTEKRTAGAITFDPATGRGTISDLGGFGQGFMDSAVFYLNDVGQGFIIDADPSTCVPVTVCPGGPPPNPTTNNAFSGTFISQSAGPFTDPNQFLSGNVIFSSGASAIAKIPSVVAAVTLNASNSTLAAAGDLTSEAVQDGNLPDVTFNGTYNLQDQTLGHGLVRLPQQIFGDFSANQLYVGFFYLIGPNQFVAIGTQQPAPGALPIYSGVIFVDPQ